PSGLLRLSRTVIVIALAAEPCDAGMVPGTADTVLLAGLAAPGVAVAVKVTGLPLTPSTPTVADRVLVPTVPPRVQLPTVSMPSAPVVAAAPLTSPPPEATANVTGTSATGVPPASRTTTAGLTATAVPAAAAWPSPAAIAAAAGAPTPSDTGVLMADA